MMEENQDHYCSPTRETDLTILADKPQQDTTYSGSQTPSDLTKEQYSEFQEEYEIPTEQKDLTSQAYQQGPQLLAESENENKESK